MESALPWVAALLRQNTDVPSKIAAQLPHAFVYKKREAPKAVF